MVQYFNLIYMQLMLNMLLLAHYTTNIINHDTDTDVGSRIAWC